MPSHEKLNYLELPASDLISTKSFFTQVFNWNFIDYGSEYMAFDNQGLEGGFYLSDKFSRSENGSTLAIFYSNNLQTTMDKIELAGGKIIQPIFSFPGGQRFHFTEPSGNEFAVWSE